jgi:effector-binding domain-containing protein
VSALKSAGFTLEEIKAVLKAGKSLDAVLDTRERELKALLSDAAGKLEQLSAIRNSLQKEGKLMFGVTIKETYYFKAVTVRRLLQNRLDIAGIIDDITAYLKNAGLSCGNSIVINYEIEHQETALDYEVGVAFTGRLPKDCPYTEKTLDIKGKTAIVVCNKEELDLAYSELVEFVGRQEFQIIGAYHEIYHDDDTVEIVLPVHKLSPRSSLPRNDDVNLPFENDVRVIGHWTLVDELVSKEQFNKSKLKHTGSKDIKDVYFLPGGKRYWIFGWTKGCLFTFSGYPKAQHCNHYEVETIDGETYMFVELKWGYYTFNNGLPTVWVLRQLDSNEYSEKDLRIKDNTDLPFTNDEAVLGSWTVCDFVREPEDFDPDQLHTIFPKDGLFWKSVTFVPGGNCKISYGDDTNYEQPHYTWTKDYVLAHISAAAERYELRRVKSGDYLFIEWKSGDYSFGGRKPAYYVFRRTE